MKSGSLLSLLLVLSGCKTAVNTSPTCQTFNSDGGVLGTPNLDAGLANLGCFYAPTATASRTACSAAIPGSCDSSGTTTPNLACLPPNLPPVDMAGVDAGPADMATAPTPKPVTLAGFVRVFDNGGDGEQVTLSLFNGAQLAMGVDPTALVPLGSTVLTLRDPPKAGVLVQAPIFPWLACDRDLTKGCTIPITTGCAVTCNDGLNGTRDQGKYCRDDGKGGVCSDRLRWEASYAQANVPVGQTLVVRVTGLNSRPDTSWASVLQWNVTIPTQDSARVCTSHSDSECYDGTGSDGLGIYRLNVTAMSQFDYSHLAVAAGLAGGIGFDHGIVLGEAHDCDGVRLQNAEVAVSPRPDRFTYFNVDPTTMTPDSRRDVTDPLGRYAALNQTPGKVTVSAGGALGAGAPFTLFGTTTAFVYANTVSLVNVGSGF